MQADSSAGQGPYVHLVGANIGPATPLPADGHIELSFDRYLNPDTVTRQSVVLTDARGNGFSPLLGYDPVTRIVSIWNPAADGRPWLASGLSYTVHLQLPSTPTDGTGLRAVDGRSLDPSLSAIHRTIGFYAIDPTNAGGPPPVSFCSEVLPVLRLQCASPSCHGSSVQGGGAPNVAAEGLLLDSPASIRATAVGIVAHESASGALANTPAPPSLTFGRNMALIAPGAPGSSFLLYKLLLARETSESPCVADADCAARGELCVHGACAAAAAGCDAGASVPALLSYAPVAPWASATAAERDLLGGYIIGREMPYPVNPGANGPPSNTTLTLQELERIRLWIQQGATVSDCGSCPGSLP